MDWILQYRQSELKVFIDMFGPFNPCTGIDPEQFICELLEEIRSDQTISQQNEKKLTILRKDKPKYNQMSRMIEDIAKAMRFYKTSSTSTWIPNLELIYDLTNQQQLQFRCDLKERSPQQILEVFVQKSNEFVERELFCHYLLKILFKSSEQQIQINYPSNMNQTGLLILNIVIALMREFPEFVNRFNEKICKSMADGQIVYDKSALKQYWQKKHSLSKDDLKFNHIDFGLNLQKKTSRLSICRNCINKQYRFCGKKIQCQAKSISVSTEDDEQSLIQQIRRLMQIMEPKFKSILTVIAKLAQIDKSYKKSEGDLQNQEIQFVKKLIKYLESLFGEHQTFKMGSDLNQNKLEKQKKALQKQISLMNFYLLQLQRHLESKQSDQPQQKEQPQEQFKGMQNQKKAWTDNCQILKIKISTLKEDKQILKQKTESQELELKQKKKQIDLLKQRIQKLQNQNNSYKSSIKEKKKRMALIHLCELDQKITGFKQKNYTRQQVQAQFMQKEEYATRLIDRYESLRRKLRDSQSRSDKLYNQLKVSYQENEKLIQQMKLANPSFLKLFQGQIFGYGHASDNKLNLKQQQLEWMVESLSKHKNTPIKDTRLLYRYDKLNPINFHCYIDNVPNLVLVVQLENGKVLAGYSEAAIKPKDCQKDKDALLMALNEKKRFRLKDGEKKKPPVTFDEYYVIFGNSEMRLKFKDDEHVMFSNFGITNSTFESEGQPVDVLMGEGKEREVKMVTYEFFEVRFGL